MGQSEKHRVVIHIECIHDPVFDMSEYRPTGAEHVRKLCVCNSLYDIYRHCGEILCTMKVLRLCHCHELAWY